MKKVKIRIDVESLKGARFIDLRVLVHHFWTVWEDDDAFQILENQCGGDIVIAAGVPALAQTIALLDVLGVFGINYEII